MVGSLLLNLSILSYGYADLTGPLRIFLFPLHALAFQYTGKFGCFKEKTLEDQKTLKSISLVTHKCLHLLPEKGADRDGCLLCSQSKSGATQTSPCYTGDQGIPQEVPSFQIHTVFLVELSKDLIN